MSVAALASERITRRTVALADVSVVEPEFSFAASGAGFNSGRSDAESRLTSIDGAALVAGAGRTSVTRSVILIVRPSSVNVIKKAWSELSFLNPYPVI